jgi:RNA polymerase sigma-70 factor (ECF subfamily)
VEDPEGVFSGSIAVDPGYHAQRELADVGVALQELPKEQRQALAHVVIRGLSYAETARLCSCKEGTIKSRVSRARQRLLETVNGPALGSRGRARTPVKRRPASPDAQLGVEAVACS